MTQDNVEKIRQKALGNDYRRPSVEDVMFLLKQVKSQDEIIDTLHIVNAELGRRVESQQIVIDGLKNPATVWVNMLRGEIAKPAQMLELEYRVESQKEVATKYHELLYQVAEKYPNETRHETALRYIKRAEEPSNCCAGEDQLPKEE